jgi:hypothetical protein
MRRRGCGADLCPVAAQVCVTSMPGISEVPHRSMAVSSVTGLAWQVPRRACRFWSLPCRRASTGPSADWAGTTAVAGRCFSDMPCRSRGWQGDNGSVGCGRTQLDVMGHDPNVRRADQAHFEATDATRTERGFHAARNGESAGQRAFRWAGMGSLIRPWRMTATHRPNGPDQLLSGVVSPAGVLGVESCWRVRPAGCWCGGGASGDCAGC